MKRLVLFLLACSVCALAQVEHGGLSIPGDGAVQAVRKRGAAVAPTPTWSTDGLIAVWIPQDYKVASGGTDEWASRVGTWTWTQLAEANKPVKGDGFLSFETTGDALGLTVGASDVTVPTYTVLIVASCAYTVYRDYCGYFQCSGSQLAVGDSGKKSLFIGSSSPKGASFNHSVIGTPYEFTYLNDVFVAGFTFDKRHAMALANQNGFGATRYLGGKIYGVWMYEGDVSQNLIKIASYTKFYWGI